MKIKMTLLRSNQTSVDLAITTEPTTPIGEIAAELLSGDPARSAGGRVASGTTLRVQESAADGSTASRVVDLRTELADSRIANGAIVSLAPDSEYTATGGSIAATLTIVNGVDAGKTVNLSVGSNSVGRGVDQKVVLTDPLVSKAHARINVSDQVELIDLGSANGSYVGLERVDRAALGSLDHVSLGDTTFTVTHIAASASAQVGGAELLNRAPRLDPQYPGRKFQSPEPPERNNLQRLPVIALIAPLVMGVVLYLVTKSLTSIIFIGLSPLLLIATYVDNRVQTRRQWKRATAEFLATIDSLETEIDDEHSRERLGRLSEAPSLRDVTSSVTVRGPLLWTRHPEHAAFLQLRLGLGSTRSRCEFELPSQRKGIPEHWSMLAGLAARTATVDGVPVVEQLRESGNVGVAGPPSVARGVARGLVAQFAGLHSPADAVIAAIASNSSSADWDWIKWLPHVGSIHSPFSAYPMATSGAGITALVSELEGVVADRVEDADGTTMPAILLIVEDDAPIDRARLVSIAETGPAVGIHLLWVSSALARIPAACRAYLDISAAGGAGTTAGFVHTAVGVQPVACEALSVENAVAFSRSLSPVVDAGARVDDASDLPRAVSLLQLVGPELARESQAVIDRWRETSSILTGPHASSSSSRSKPNLRAVFGQGTTEPFAIDLRADGPHALVGGTTGSGKSEFLQAWVLGLAAAHSPQRVSFLFVDYKGGSAFANCTELPHSVGIVTDLSQHMVRRALTSLRAELRYREHLFLSHGYKDIIEFEQSGNPDVPPSLLIVVDEFAALVTEVPEFVDGVVDVAQRGRSLGLHLILATQRPAGVIKDNLRANTNLRIALRMADEGDSLDVLGTPVAATFDPSIPGRGAVRTGPGRIRGFQSGYAGGWTASVTAPASIAIEELTFGPPNLWESPKDDLTEAAVLAASAGPTDIVRIVANVRRAAELAAIPAPRKPWLPVLATSYDFSKLPNRRTDSELVLGVVDDASAQAQPTIAYYPDRDGNMAIIGTGGSGKTTTLRTIAVAAGVTSRGGLTHVYGLDFASGGLQMLAGLPHVGTIVSGDDEERVGRLLRWLRDLVDQRSVRYAEARAGNIVEYRQIAKASDEPRIILLLDGMSAFRDAYESSLSTPWFAVLSQIATDGLKLGIHVVVTGDRAGSIPASLSSSIQRRIILRLAKQDDYSVFDVPDDILTSVSPPGRAVVDGLEAQLAVLGGDPNVSVQSRKIDELAAAMVKAGVTAAPRVERLVEQVSLSSLPADVSSAPTIGIADDTLGPIGIPTGGAFVIAGPPGSGRTTTLVTVATALARARPKMELYHLSARRSDVGGLKLWKKSADSPDEVRELLSALAARISGGELAPGALALFIEHLADFHESELERDMEGMIKSGVRSEQLVVGESETSTWNQAYSVGRPMRAGRQGIILQPEDSDADLLRANFGRVRGWFPPGRGYLVGGGRSRKVQVATTDDVDSASPMDG
ncbi:MAG TPA: FtsK/SpoIIIE domain-containing protein [Galbitalea sp.]|nr:FtsK/SpoIIIE domain-containing protein [Galbitalea sp.]